MAALGVRVVSINTLLTSSGLSLFWTFKSLWTHVVREKSFILL